MNKWAQNKTRVLEMKPTIKFEMLQKGKKKKIIVDILQIKIEPYN